MKTWKPCVRKSVTYYHRMQVVWSRPQALQMYRHVRATCESRRLVLQPRPCWPKQSQNLPTRPPDHGKDSRTAFKSLCPAMVCSSAVEDRDKLYVEGQGLQGIKGRSKIFSFNDRRRYCHPFGQGILKKERLRDRKPHVF